MKVSFNVSNNKDFISSNTNSICLKNKKNPSFGINLKSLTETASRSAHEIEKDLFRQYDINANFRGNDLIANCVEKTTKIFSEIFGKDYLPQKIEFKSFNFVEAGFKNALGLFYSGINNKQPLKNIYINSDYGCHHNATLLNINCKIARWLRFHSTSNPLKTFVHEYAHCAHFSNIFKKGYSFQDLKKFPIPELNFRIINSDALGKYAVRDNDICELTAEALTRQILDYPETIKPHDKNTLFNFYDIHDGKGQKYMQAIWNGELDKIQHLTEEVHIESNQRNWEDHVTRTEYVFDGLGL